jgi:hypothetical protein
MAKEQTEIERTSGRDGCGRFEKGRAVGRPKGSLNKTTAALREALKQSFEEVGGVDYLVKLARTDPKTYCRLLAKLIPDALKLEGRGDDMPLVVIKDYTGGKGGA